jgi:predicted RNA-binding Zn ribbon-like protein
LETLHAHGDTYTADSGHVVLDYVNTLSWRTRAEKVEFMSNYLDLVTWGVISGLLTEEQARSYLEEASKAHEQAAAVYLRSIALREALYHILSAYSSTAPPALADIAVLNQELAQALSFRRLKWSEDGFNWSWEEGPGDLESLLWKIAGAAADLLTSATLERVGECQGVGCGWLFIDTSKNHSRRWCDMEGCGNRAKARRHYKRKQAA